MNVLELKKNTPKMERTRLMDVYQFNNQFVGDVTLKLTGKLDPEGDFRVTITKEYDIENTEVIYDKIFGMEVSDPKRCYKALLSCWLLDGPYRWSRSISFSFAYLKEIEEFIKKNPPSRPYLIHIEYATL